MGYFDEVYLKRINIDGKNQQERVKTRKEKEFDRLFLKKTEYQVLIKEVNGEKKEFLGSLQPNKWNESNLIGNLLISTSAAPLKTGDILLIHQQIKDVEYDKLFLVIFVEENITKGYQLFKVLCLDSEVNITDEYGTTINSYPVKYVSATATLVQDNFLYTKGNYGYREPQAIRCFITSDFDGIKKGAHFIYKDRRWEIQGKDNISIDNVAYVTASERLMKEEEPISSEEIEVGEDKNFFLIGR